MEHVIAKLLQDFERGRMSRRQLIQSLALAATAASAAGAAPAQTTPSAGRGIKVLGINHVNIEVADYAKTRDFYGGMLGMKVTDDEGTRAQNPRPRCKLWAGNIYLWPRTRPSGLLSVAINTCTANSRRIAAPNWLENRVTNGKFSREEEGSLIFHHPPSEFAHSSF